MAYRVECTTKALKQLKKMDRFDARLILSWIEKNLVGCEDPRRFGKGLTANRNGEWRYRVGDYRILCTINDGLLTVEVFTVGHRRDVCEGWTFFEMPLCINGGSLPGQIQGLGAVSKSLR